MNVEKLVALAKEAERIATGVSDPYRAVLFGKALEELIKEQSLPKEKVMAVKSESSSETVKTEDRSEKLRKIFSTHLDAGHGQRILEKGNSLECSLLVLDIAEREFGLSELMPPEIAKILSLNLGIKGSPNAVSMALKKATNRYVRRRSEAKGFAYLLTPAGKEHLKKSLDGGASGSS
jgi:hypothetical protein